MAKNTFPTCMHCGQTGLSTTGKDVYPGRPDLARKRFFRCPSCPDTFIGCHGNGRTLGPVMANKATRQARMKAHTSFDKLWHDGPCDSRRDAYTLLEGFLGVPKSEAHIGHLTEEGAIDVARWADGLMREYRLR